MNAHFILEILSSRRDQNANAAEIYGARLHEHNLLMKSKRWRRSKTRREVKILKESEAQEKRRERKKRRKKKSASKEIFKERRENDGG